MVDEWIVRGAIYVAKASADDMPAPLRKWFGWQQLEPFHFAVPLSGDDAESRLYLSERYDFQAHLEGSRFWISSGSLILHSARLIENQRISKFDFEVDPLRVKGWAQIVRSEWPGPYDEP
ncbi:MAG: hypothetical protein ACK4P3_07365 [Fimbriimonadaceae bacterium]|jgi:hypothetical protein